MVTYNTNKPYLRQRKDIAVRNASNASGNVFKGLLAHLRLTGLEQSSSPNKP
jgi:hypothetical protein